MIRLPIPDLTEERRKELAKLASQYAEKARIAVRNVRRDGNKLLDQEQKDKLLTEDDRDKGKEEVQKLTKSYEDLVNDPAKKKEDEIMEQ